MTDFQRIGFIRRDLDALKAWCRAQTPTMQASVSTYLTYSPSSHERGFLTLHQLTLPK
jgi:hypothetical protein